MRRIVVAVGGTPGTGKSVFARALANKIKAQLVDLNAIITEKKCYTPDADGTKVVDVLEMRKVFARALRAYRGPVVAEGLLSHMLQRKLITHVVVLRTSPEVLKKRLSARGYHEKKTRENVEAEALDIILCEAVEAHGIDKVYEIDATKLKPNAAVKMFLDALSRKVSLRPGKISWLEEYLKTTQKLF